MSVYEAWSHHGVYSLRLSERARHSQRGCLTHLFPRRAGGLGVWGSGVQLPAWPRSVRASFLASDGASSPCPFSAESEQARCLFPCLQGRQFSQTKAPPCGSFNFRHLLRPSFNFSHTRGWGFNMWIWGPLPAQGCCWRQSVDPIART